MNLTSSCIITSELPKLREFYEAVLQVPAEGDDMYVEFKTGQGKLALFSWEKNEQIAPGSLLPAQNWSVILEFEVEDVDKEYERLQSLEIVWVKPPATHSWGTRSVWFRDPDGNTINFYCRVK